MTAYAILTRESTINQSALDAYGIKAAQARAGHPITARVRYGAFEMLEGEPIEGVVVLEFPTTQAARDWYFSDKYQEALQLRKAGANYRVLIVEGL